MKLETISDRKLKHGDWLKITVVEATKENR